MSDIRQFKLVTGEEIVCNVVEWNDPQVDDNIVIKNAMQITYGALNAEPGQTQANRAAILVPWFLHQIEPDTVQTLNLAHATAEAMPGAQVLDYYLSTINLMLTPEDDEFPVEDYDRYIEEMEDLDPEKDITDIDSNVMDLFKKKPTIH